MKSQSELNNKAVLNYHAKSFRWGGFFLPREVLNESALIYAFCRLVDDLADEASSEAEAREALFKVKAELLGEDPRPLVRDFRRLFSNDLKPALELLEGVTSDLGPVRIVSKAELLRYCYLVAGTVGLMMCKPLGVFEEKPKEHAVSLGIAMQLTNICRDVGEDFVRDRIYIPKEILKGTDTLLGRDESQKCVRAFSRVLPERDLALAVDRLLQMAEDHYSFGREGYRYIPWRQRLAIIVASNLYREIGVQIRRENFPVLHRRVYVHPARKCWVVLKSIFEFLRGI